MQLAPGMFRLIYRLLQLHRGLCGAARFISDVTVSEHPVHLPRTSPAGAARGDGEVPSLLPAFISGVKEWLSQLVIVCFLFCFIFFLSTFSPRALLIRIPVRLLCNFFLSWFSLRWKEQLCYLLSIKWQTNTSIFSTSSNFNSNHRPLLAWRIHLKTLFVLPEGWISQG